MFQLYPKFMKNNIPVLIQVMMEALAIRPPAFEIVLAKYTGGTGTCEETSEETESGRQSSSPSASKKHRTTLLRRTYFSRMGELVAAQAKTLSFLTYLLRTFAAELKPYEDRLASNVVALMTNCPRESMGTRKELLVATRHLLNSDFRRGFTRHVDTLLADERVLMGSHHRWSDQALLRPLGYTTLSDLVQHVRGQLSQQQLSKVCSLFSRVLHDEAQPLPLSTQYTAVRTLLGIVDLIFHNKQESDAQLGRDMLVRLLLTLVDKLEALNASFPAIFRAEAGREEQKRRRNAATRPVDVKDIEAQEESVNEGPPEQVSAVLLATAQPDSVKDVQSMIRAIVVGCKSVIYYICNYRKQREKEKAASSGGEKRENTFLPPPGSNEEVSSAMLNMTNTEIELVDRYILTAFPAIKLLIKTPTDEGSAPDDRSNALSGTGEKTLQEQYRDALTYFAATFTVMDGHNLRRSLGKRLDLLVDTIIDDPMVMVVPRHLLASNPTTSYEFCSTLLDYLMKHMDLLAGPPPRCASQKGGSNTVIFFSDDPNRETSAKDYIQEQLNKVSQLPAESDEMKTRRSSTLLHLFERVLKSLSTYANNEAVLRRYLRRIVIISLRSSMENVSVWPDSYCMLLRYVFRSISAGKFEESYKELLPLIPTVLNGLYRVVSASEDSVLRCTAIELCLTIPARLSSLLPHMNLLLRVIVPALESDSGDLVNLG
jgi:transformation/transcription domain-associated protein